MGVLYSANGVSPSRLSENSREHVNNPETSAKTAKLLDNDKPGPPKPKGNMICKANAESPGVLSYAVWHDEGPDCLVPTAQRHLVDLVFKSIRGTNATLLRYTTIPRLRFFRSEETLMKLISLKLSVGSLHFICTPANRREQTCNMRRNFWR